MLPGLVLSNSSLVFVAIMAYLGVWVYLVARMFIASHRRHGVMDIQRVALYNYLAVTWRKYGWILALLLLLVSFVVVPEVRLVSYNPNPSLKYVVSPKWKRDGVFIRNEGIPAVERFYVPFWYRGRFCGPFMNYVYNAIDDTLMLYETKYLRRKYFDVSMGKTIPPGGRVAFGSNIVYYFTVPSQSEHEIVTYGSRKIEDVETDWCIDTKSAADSAIKLIKWRMRENLLPTKRPLYIPDPVSQTFTDSGIPKRLEYVNQK